MVLKSNFLKVEYYWHLYHKRHLELLMKDCISEEIRMKMKVKMLYHQSKVVELFYKMNAAF